MILRYLRTFGWNLVTLYMYIATKVGYDLLEKTMCQLGLFSKGETVHFMTGYLPRGAFLHYLFSNDYLANFRLTRFEILEFQIVKDHKCVMIYYNVRSDSLSFRFFPKTVVDFMWKKSTRIN